MTKLYKSHHKRLKIILFFTVFFISISALKTIYIQLFMIQNQSIDKQVERKGDRGSIYDRNNQRLAYDIDFYDIYVEELSDSDIPIVEYVMSEYFDKHIFSPQNLVLNRSKGKQYLLEGVPYYFVERLDGVFKKYPQIKKSIKYKGRHYPEGGLASQLIGSFSHKNDTIGRWGIERVLNQRLKAKTGFLDYLVTSRGFNLKNYSNDEYLALSGEDVKLTIDIDYQRILEQELMSQLKATSSESANGIIVDPYTGEILALASVPTADLNKRLPSIELTSDNVCHFSYEPGSTLKPFSVLAGISNGKINLSQKYYCENGKYWVPNLKRKPVEDHEPHDTLSVKEILAHSSNIGLVKISYDTGSQDIYNMFKTFGFGQYPEIDSYREISGRLTALNDWDKYSLVAIPIGQELRVTNLQIAMAYSAIANGGYLLEPKIIIGDSSENGPNIIRKVANKNDIDLLIESLKMVVTDGTASSVMQDNLVCSYGKTGTAQVWVKAEQFTDTNDNKKYDEGEEFVDANNNEKWDKAEYSSSNFISSYAGVFPCDKPELVCVISFINPDESKKWASQSAVPAFNEILSRIANEDRDLSIEVAYETR